MMLCGFETEFHLDGKVQKKKCGKSDGHPSLHTVMFKCEEHDMPYVMFFNNKGGQQLYHTILNGDGTVPEGVE